MHARRRALIALSVLALIGAACNRGGSGSGDTVSHGFEPGAELVYDTVVAVSGTMGVTEGSGLSIDIPVEVTVSFTDTYSVAAGDEPGTFRITQVQSGFTVDGDFGFLGNTDDLFPPGISEPGPPIEFVVDHQGFILETAVEGLPSEITDLLSAAGQQSFLGVSLPPDSSRSGARWTSRAEIELGGLRVSADTENRVAGRDTSGGGDVLTIESSVTVSPIRADLFEVLLALFESADFRELAEIPEDEVDEVLLGFRVLEASGAVFRIDTERTVVESTGKFDAVAGRFDSITTTASGSGLVELTGLSDLGGGLTEGIGGDFTIELTFQADASIELVSD